MKKYTSSILVFLNLLGLVLSSSANAQTMTSASAYSKGLSIEPLVGYETVYRSTPTAHTSSRLFYGIRATLGVPKLSGEGEYVTAQDTENYSTAPQSIVNKDDKIKLGLRSTFDLGQLFFISGRGGVQASRNINETTTNGNRTVVTNDFKYDPYAGASLGIKFGKSFSLALGSTVVFKDFSDFSKEEYQNTLSFTWGL